MQTIFKAYIYNETGLVVSTGKSAKSDKAIRIAAKRTPVNQGVLTIKVMEWRREK